MTEQLEALMTKRSHLESDLHRAIKQHTEQKEWFEEQRLTEEYQRRQTLMKQFEQQIRESKQSIDSCDTEARKIKKALMIERCTRTSLSSLDLCSIDELIEIIQGLHGDDERKLPIPRKTKKQFGYWEAQRLFSGCEYFLISPDSGHRKVMYSSKEEHKKRLIDYLKDMSCRYCKSLCHEIEQCTKTSYTPQQMHLLRQRAKIDEQLKKISRH